MVVVGMYKHTWEMMVNLLQADANFMSEAKSFLSPEADGSLSEEEEKEDKNKTNSLEVRIMLNNNIYDTL